MIKTFGTVEPLLPNFEVPHHNINDDDDDEEDDIV